MLAVSDNHTDNEALLKQTFTMMVNTVSPPPRVKRVMAKVDARLHK